MDTSGFDRIARRISGYSEPLLRLPPEIKEQAFDIHIKSGQPLSVCGREGVFFLREGGGVSRALTEDLIRIPRERLQEVFLEACAHSVFSHDQEIPKGYIQMEGGCRVGVCGTAVTEKGEIKSVREISSLVFRIPREIRGCGDRLFLEGAGLHQGVLIAGEPSSGKTTLLRDIAFSLSIGKFQPIRRVAVLDQRGEIGGNFDLGPCTDILQGYPKAEAFDIAIRMLSPEYILCDELSADDLGIVQQSVFSGAALIASVHASRQDLKSRPLCRKLLETGAFGIVVCLEGRSQPGEIGTIEVEGRGEIRGAPRHTDDPVQRRLPGLEEGE